MIKENYGKIILIIALLAIAACLFLCTDEKKSVKKQRPTKVDTTSLTTTEMLLPVVSPVGNNPVDRGVISVKPLEPRSKWTSSLSFMIMDLKNGKPINGVKVDLQGPISLPSAWSDEDGNVAYSKLPSGIYYANFTHDVYSTNNILHGNLIDLKKGEHKEVLIEMVSSCIVKGRVIDALSGEPLAKVAVFANRYEDNDPVYTKSDGEFSIPTGELNRAEIYLNREGYSPQNVYFGCVDGTHDLGDIVMTASWILRGKVVDENGEPLVGVEVLDYPKKNNMAMGNNLVTAKTDSYGKFSMTGLPTTNEIIFFYKKGYASTNAAVSPTTPQDFEIRMFKECTLTGSVEDNNGQVLEGVTVMAITSRWRENNSIITKADGGFALAVQPGYVQLWLIYRNEGGQIREHVSASCETDMEPLKLVLNVDNLTKSSGIVLDSNGVAVVNAMVVTMGMSENSSFPKRHITTNQAGKFELAVPDRDSYKIAAFAFDKKESGYTEELRGAKENLEIHLKDFSGNSKLPQSGIAVDLEGRQIMNYSYCFSACTYKMRADENGMWLRRTDSFADYPPIWIFTDDGKIGKARRIRTTDEEVAKVVIGVGASLKGRLSEDFSAGLTTLELGYGMNLVKKVISQEFEFPLLPPGPYSIKLTTAEGRRLDIEHIEIVNGEAVDLGEISFTASD